jgi:hypothetical protein
MLNPLTLMKIGALFRHVLHVPRIHQTRFDAMLLQDVVHRNPIHTVDSIAAVVTPQRTSPVRHLMQIFSECLALPHRVGVSIRRYCHEDLSGSDVDASRIRLKQRVLHGLSSTGSFAVGHLGPGLTGTGSPRGRAAPKPRSSTSCLSS